jgi:hypothetical protein
MANFGVCPHPSSLAFLAPNGLALRRFAPGCPQLSFTLVWVPSEAMQAVKVFVEHFRKHGPSKGDDPIFGGYPAPKGL